MIPIIGLIRSNNLHQQQLFKSIFFHPMYLLSVYCLFSVECLMWKPRTLQFMCLLFRYVQSPKKDHNWWGSFFLWQVMTARAALLKGAMMDVCATDSNISVKQNMMHKTVRVLFIGWQCHIRFSTKPSVETASSVDGRQLLRWAIGNLLEKVITK